MRLPRYAACALPCTSYATLGASLPQGMRVYPDGAQARARELVEYVPCPHSTGVVNASVGENTAVLRAGLAAADCAVLSAPWVAAAASHVYR